MFLTLFSILWSFISQWLYYRKGRSFLLFVEFAIITFFLLQIAYMGMRMSLGLFTPFLPFIVRYQDWIYIVLTVLASQLADFFFKKSSLNTGNKDKPLGRDFAQIFFYFMMLFITAFGLNLTFWLVVILDNLLNLGLISGR